MHSPQTINKVLIANRGEIAVRIARTAATLGIKTVAVYSDDDADALHVRVADEAWSLGGKSSRETYLSTEALLTAIRRSGADAVHPGYGFLSENADFARAVEASGVIWIGPAPETIELLGDKISARRIAQQVSAPLAAGSDGPAASRAEAIDFAKAHGLPIVIKAAFGGGGRGMRIAHELTEVGDLYDAAVREAEAAFGRGECFLEQYLERPRHVEAQILGDGNGTVVVVGTRDCSAQRRNQKLVEEAPAPFLTAEQQRSIIDSAQRICRAVNYRGAGTVEFLVSAEGNISFLEVNTRLQVEHPVTEMTSGLDLVAEQFRIARGLQPSVTQTPVPQGHAIELRINAEDPGRGFIPSPGRIDRWEIPGGPGVRVDAGVATGSLIPPSFDSLAAKLVVWGPTRDIAVARAQQAAKEFTVEGVSTVLPFSRRLLADPAFGSDGFSIHTRWIEDDCPWLDELAEDAATPTDSAPITSTWLEIDGRRHAVRLPTSLAGAFGESRPAADSAPSVDDAELLSPANGTVVTWLSGEDDAVIAGSRVAVIESMKMEIPVLAHANGTLRHRIDAGTYVTAGSVLCRIE